MNITRTAYVIRRKKDGYCYNDKGWVKDFSTCRLFKTSGGAKSSRGWRDTKIIITENACDACKAKAVKNRDDFSPGYHMSYDTSKHAIRNWQRDRIERIAYAKKNGYVSPPTLEFPCWQRVKLTSKENPLEVVKVTVSIFE